MSGKSKRTGSNLRKVDEHVIAPAEYEELPEVTEDMLARAEYRVRGRLRVHPRRRGPQKSPTKIALSLRLSPEVVAHFKSSGRGWQTRFDDTLKKAIGSKRHSAKA